MQIVVMEYKLLTPMSISASILFISAIVGFSPRLRRNPPFTPLILGRFEDDDDELHDDELENLHSAELNKYLKGALTD